MRGLDSQDSRRAKPRAVRCSIFVALGPAFLTDYWVSFILTQTFLLGVAAASLIFLSAYGGMVSLAQTAIFGIAGFLAGQHGDDGRDRGTKPRLESVARCRARDRDRYRGRPSCLARWRVAASGIYFLMITLAFGVIGFYFFLQVDKLSGRAGIPQIRDQRTLDRRGHRCSTRTPLLRRARSSR